jgi:hypothetical protein
MARNTVHCKLCSKAFFPGSIEIHMKQCVKKMALVPVSAIFMPLLLLYEKRYMHALFVFKFASTF